MDFEWYQNEKRKDQADLSVNGVELGICFKKGTQWVANYTSPFTQTPTSRQICTLASQEEAMAKLETHALEHMATVSGTLKRIVPGS